MSDDLQTLDATQPVEAAAAATADTTTTPETTPDTTATGAEAAAATDTTTEEKPVTPTWPEDWREQLAGGDEAFLRQLKRYSSPSTFAKGWKEREDLIRSGKLKRDMPDASDEKAMAEWRKEQGIPDKPDGYKLPDPVVKRLTDEDKPVLASFLEFAHGKGAPPAVVEIASEWYINQMEAAAAQQNQRDRAAKEAVEDYLRADWGPEYHGNMEIAKRYIAQVPGIGAKWAEFRSPDGTRLGDNPEFVRWIAERAMNEEYGEGGFERGDVAARFASRLTEIETIMKTDIDRYYSEGLQKEHAELMAREAKRQR